MKVILTIAKVIAVIVLAAVLTIAILFGIFLIATYYEREEIPISESIRTEIESMYKEVVDVKADTVGLKEKNGTMIEVAVTIYFKTQDGMRAVRIGHMHSGNLLEGSLLETSGEEQNANH